MEEALGSDRAALVIGEVRRLDGTASCRLQLAAETGATPALLVNDGDHAAALTCWRVGSAPSGPAADGPGLGAPRLALNLLRARGAAPGAWLSPGPPAGTPPCQSRGIARRPRPPGAAVQHQLLGKRHPRHGHKAKILRWHPLRGRKAGPRQLRRPNEDMRQAPHFLLALSWPPTPGPGRDTGAIPDRPRQTTLRRNGLTARTFAPVTSNAP